MSSRVSPPGILLRGINVLCAAASVIACALGSMSTAAALEDVNFLVAAPPTLPAFGPLVLAKHLGYYSNAGYDVNFQVAHGGFDIAVNVGAGNAPFGLSLGDAPIVVRGRGIPIKIVAMLGGGALGVLVARKDRGISKIEGLRGKKISVMSFQEANYYATLAALAAHGIEKKDVEIQAVGPAGVTSRGNCRRNRRLHLHPGLGNKRRGRGRRNRCHAAQGLRADDGTSDRFVRRPHREASRIRESGCAGKSSRLEAHHGRS